MSRYGKLKYPQRLHVIATIILQKFEHWTIEPVWAGHQGGGGRGGGVRKEEEEEGAIYENKKK